MHHHHHKLQIPVLRKVSHGRKPGSIVIGIQVLSQPSRLHAQNRHCLCHHTCSMNLPPSLSRAISPPHASKRRKTSQAPHGLPAATNHHDAKHDPGLAAVEAGRAKLEDHLSYFKYHLTRASRSTANDVPRTSIDEFSILYQSNQHQHGHHFVIHQHNHPKAGVHYDLRLQFSATSSVSWAFPKGLPGNPNSRQLGRMAVETRVHNLWNNLIESASTKTGSLLIWDTGTYSVLPRHRNEHEMPSPQTTGDESDRDERTLGLSGQENTKLIEAFQTRHIRLRLHGTRLPKGYTITLRLPSMNDVPKTAAARRRRSRTISRNRRPSHTSDSDCTPTSVISSHPTPTEANDDDDVSTKTLDTDSEEDALTRTHNAYPGSTNSIGSVHQRRWFVLLDRQSSGFELSGGKWIRRIMADGELDGFKPFVVRGRDHERSVVTGRLACDVEDDEGCNGYVGRGGWKSIED